MLILPYSEIHIINIYRNKMGFEAEVKGIQITERILPSNPLIDKVYWSLFTDMGSDTNNMLEFATNYGYKRKIIGDIAKDVQSTLIGIIERVRNRVEFLSTLDAFKNVMKLRTEKLGIINKCLLSANNDAFASDMSIDELKTSILCLLSRANNKNLDPDEAYNYFNKLSKCFIDDINNNIKRVKNKLIKYQKMDLQSIQKNNTKR